MTTATEPLLLSVEEAAHAMRVSRRTLFTLTKDEGLPCVRLGSRVLYDPNDLRAWIHKHKAAGSE
jgi:excisionase family DNA binding protein